MILPCGHPARRSVQTSKAPIPEKPACVQLSDGGLSPRDLMRNSHGNEPQADLTRSRSAHPASHTSGRLYGAPTFTWGIYVGHPAKVITALIALSVATTGLILANMFLMMMVGEINRRRQDENTISYFGFTFPKMLRIFREYRTLNPVGVLHLFSLGAFGIALIALLVVATCIGIVG